MTYDHDAAIAAIEQRVASLRARIVNTLREYLPHGSRYAFMEWPDYPNVGDTAIWLGSLSVLREVAGRDPSYVCQPWNYSRDDMRKVVGDGPIFLQGGGGFGDLHTFFQDFRQRVIGENMDRKIVQLPQSIYYRHVANAAPAINLYGKHPDIHLLVRDQPSMDFARQHLPVEPVLCPDMAFGLGFLGDQRTGGLVSLLRDDDERREVDMRNLSEDMRPEKNGPRQLVDWKDPPGLKDRFRVRRLFSRYPRLKLYELIAEERFKNGRDLLRSDRILTDRLHGHIIGTLMGIPTVVLDNSYGKNHAVMEMWTKDLPSVSLVKTGDDASRALRRLTHPAKLAA